jgi:hypothetical protein
MMRSERKQRGGDVTLGLQQAEHDQVGVDARKRLLEFRHMATFVGDEANVLDRLRQEPPDVRFVVEDACARHGMPLPE